MALSSFVPTARQRRSAIFVARLQRTCDLPRDCFDGTVGDARIQIVSFLHLAFKKIKNKEHGVFALNKKSVSYFFFFLFFLFFLFRRI